MLILISTSVDKQLPTIRSRCQTIRFAPLSIDAVERILLDDQFCDDPAAAHMLARYSGGSVHRALEARDPELWAFREMLLDRLARPGFDTLAVAKSISEFVGTAGKEAALRRQRLRQVIEFAVDFYRQAVRADLGLSNDSDQQTATAVAALLESGVDIENLERSIERCLEAIGHLERNVHLTTLIDAWIDDVGRFGRVGQAPACRA